MVAEATLLEVEDLQFEEDDRDDEAVIVPNGRRTIRTNSADPEIDSLYGKWKRGKLILQPYFQRQFVWDRTKASRLIESRMSSSLCKRLSPAIPETVPRT